MDSLYDFALEKLKANTWDDMIMDKENIANVIVNSIRKEFEAYYRFDRANPDILISKLQNTVTEILAANNKLLIDQVYLALNSAILELDTQVTAIESLGVQDNAKSDTKKAIENELEKIREAEMQQELNENTLQFGLQYQQDIEQEQQPFPQHEQQPQQMDVHEPWLQNQQMPITDGKTSESTPKDKQLGKVSLLGKLFGYARRIREKIHPAKKGKEVATTTFVGEKHVWYDENDQEIEEPTHELLDEYNKKGLHYIEIKSISPESELIVHHLGKIEQRTTQNNEQQPKQLNILSKQLTGNASDIDIFKPLLKRLKEMNPLKEVNMRKMAKEFENMAQFMYMINRDILKGKNAEELNRIKLGFEVNLRNALVHEQRGTLDYVVFEELLETVCSTYQKAEKDEVAKKVSEDMERLLTFLKEERENRLSRLATERPLKNPEGIPSEILTDMVTTYIGTDAITMTREEFLRMLEEREELAKEDVDPIHENTTHNSVREPKKYTPFTFPYERAFQLNGKSFITEGGKIISEDGNEYIKTAEGRLVLKEGEQR